MSSTASTSAKSVADLEAESKQLDNEYARLLQQQINTKKATIQELSKV